MLHKYKDSWTLFYSNSTNRRFVHILLVAIFVRILLMPFYGHIDVLSEARRVFFWAENNLFFDTITRNTTMNIEVLFYRATSFLLPDRNAMFSIANIANSTATIPNSFEFVSHYTIFRTLFILKLPFLIFDILTAIVLYNYFQDKEKCLNSCKLWLFNPVTIFAFYIFGRFESIPIFFVAAGLLALKRNRILLGAILIGLCINGREMMIIYAPLFIFTILFASLKEVSYRDKLLSIFIILGFTVVALQLYSFVMPETQNAVGGKIGTVINEGRVRYLFDFSIQGIMLIPFTYALAILWISSSERNIHDKFLLGCALSMISFFAFSSHTAHFTSWVMIFPAIFYGYNKRILIPSCALCLVWFIYWTLLTDLGVFTLWLASAYSLNFVGLPNIPAYLKEFSNNLGIFNITMLIYLSRTVWVATLLYLSIAMIKITLNNDDK